MKPTDIASQLINYGLANNERYGRRSKNLLDPEDENFPIRPLPTPVPDPTPAPTTSPQEPTPPPKDPGDPPARGSGYYMPDGVTYADLSLEEKIKIARQYGGVYYDFQGNEYKMSQDDFDYFFNYTPDPTPAPEPDPTPTPAPGPSPSPAPEPSPSPAPEPTPAPAPEPTPAPPAEGIVTIPTPTPAPYIGAPTMPPLPTPPPPELTDAFSSIYGTYDPDQIMNLVYPQSPDNTAGQEDMANLLALQQGFLPFIYQPAPEPTPAPTPTGVPEAPIEGGPVGGGAFSGSNPFQNFSGNYPFGMSYEDYLRILNQNMGLNIGGRNTE